MTTVTTLLVGVALGFGLSAVLRRKAVERAPREPGQTFIAPGRVVAPAGPAKVMVVSGTSNKIRDIKTVRACTQLGLKDAKDVVDNLPTLLVSGVSEEHGRWMVDRLQAAGMTATVS